MAAVENESVNAMKSATSSGGHAVSSNVSESSLTESNISGSNTSGSNTSGSNTSGFNISSFNIPGFNIFEQIHQSGPRVIFRATRMADGEPVILKTLLAQYPRKQDLAEIRREYSIAKRLTLPGIIQMYSLQSYAAGNLVIEMEPFGLSLTDYMIEQGGQALPVDTFFSIALELVNILGSLHEQNIVHKDIVPRNVLIDSTSGALRLIDFGISSELSQERQNANLSKRLEGSLPYISPEQTGRVNRDVDYRSDYYSLGVTFFELLTGTLPFKADNALEWVHRHISQAPMPAHSVNKLVPEQLSKIVLKLMSKNTEDRYQSSYGLLADLKRCRDDLKSGSDSSFSLGQADISQNFQVSQCLYGRQTELEGLQTEFEKVSRGEVSLCLVSGYSGVGKSALVNEFGQSVAHKQGYLIQGKFDQFRQGSAYSAIAEAFQSLIKQLLSEPKTCLDEKRILIQEALDENGQLMVDLVPELELIIGKQAAVPKLLPTEAQNRFQIVFVKFIKALSSQQHPLVIFIDDLQWCDIPTLNLFKRIVSARDLSHVLLIGAYRSNEVDVRHPLIISLDQIKQSRKITTFLLNALDRHAVESLVADTLKTSVKSCQALSDEIFDKTHANPFFINELLKSLYEDGAIRFDTNKGCWLWDMAVVQRANVGGNVVDFMVANLKRLDESTQKVLQLAACIGNSFDLRTLSIIFEQSMAKTSAALNVALQRNIIFPLNESYKYVGLSQDAINQNGQINTDDLNDDLNGGKYDEDMLIPRYKFQHDKVQQAAYALIDKDLKQHIHLSIGRLIQKHSDEQECEKRLIEIVTHLNEGRACIDNAKTRGAELHQLACLNLAAGIKAKSSSAYDEGLTFLKTGKRLLGDNAWSQHYDLMLSFSKEIQQCAYLTGQFEEADKCTDSLLQETKSPLVKAEILSARTRQYATTGRMNESIESAFEGLSLLGINLVQSPDDDVIEKELSDVEKNLGGRDIADLIHSPNLTNPEIKIAIDLLMEIFPAAFLSGSGNLFPYLVLKSVNLSLRHGNCPESAFAYAAYGMLLCGKLKDPALGYQYGKLGVDMNELFSDITLKSRILYVYAMFIHHWSHHWSTMTPWFLKGIEAGYQSGDMLYLAYSAQDCIIWDPSLTLEQASQEQKKYLSIVKDCEYQDSLDSGTLFLQMQNNFQGLTESLYSMNDANFDEVNCLQGMQQRRFMTGIANYYIYKAEIHYFYDDYTGAMKHVLEQDKLIASAMSLPQLVRFYLIAFLTRASLFKAMDDSEKKQTQYRLQQDLAQMQQWADVCPENFQHLCCIMQAEEKRLMGDFSGALNFYEQAISLANQNGFQRDEALANELAAKCLLQSGLAKAASGYLSAARYLYYRWGALRKVEEMERLYPQLNHIQKTSSHTIMETLSTRTRAFDSSSLDMSSVIKASQTISEEIIIEKLLKITMQILLENAGGQKGCFVVLENEQLVIKSQCALDSSTSSDSSSSNDSGSIVVGLDSEQTLLPVSVINRVLRTGTPQVLNNASEDGQFVSDPYIVSQQPKSVICIPMQRHGKFSGAIYMENNLTTGAFTEDRIEVIKLLAAQASISMENAKIYQDQLRLTQAQQRFVPSQFLQSLGHEDIANVGLGEFVAREMSVMFADLRDFTPMVERFPPGDVIKLLNRYFSQLAEPIASAGGFIDSYNGDEIMALFSLPSNQAVEAGIAMCRALEVFNQQSVLNGEPVFKMGLGINTGPLVLGTVGGADRLKCGVVGDTVNLASRIEQLTKIYDVPFLIGEDTYKSLESPEKFSIRMIDYVAVKGKQLAIKLYEVLDAESPERRASKEATQALLTEAMSYYYERNFVEASKCLQTALLQDKDDAVLSIFLERSQRYENEAPAADWQGVEVLMNK